MKNNFHDFHDNLEKMMLCHNVKNLKDTHKEQAFYFQNTAKYSIFDFMPLLKYSQIYSE